MTNITLIYGSGMCSLHIEGHAGYHPGNDIVCAGISTLAYTLVNAIRHIASELKVRDLSIDDTEDGIIDVSFDFVPFDNKVMTIIETIEIGFEMMRQNYSDFVTLQVGKA